jgi:hypothetical protein
LRGAQRAQGVLPHPRLLALVLRKGRITCTIYAPEPRDERDAQRFATLGHELMHCFDGNWHDRWGRMNDAKVREARRSAAGAGAGSAVSEN